MDLIIPLWWQYLLLNQATIRASSCWVVSSLCEVNFFLMSHLKRKPIMNLLVLIGSIRWNYQQNLFSYLFQYSNNKTNFVLYIDKNVWFIKYLILSLFQLWMKRIFRLSALVCLVSVSLNTPKTFEMYPFLRYVTLTCDIATSLLFTAEMVVKINTRGLVKVCLIHFLLPCNLYCIFFPWKMYRAKRHI